MTDYCKIGKVNNSLKTIIIWFFFAVLSLNEPGVSIPDILLNSAYGTAFDHDARNEQVTKKEFVSSRNAYNGIIFLRNNNNGVKTFSRRDAEATGTGLLRFSHNIAFNRPCRSIEFYIDLFEQCADFPRLRGASDCMDYIHGSDGKK